jgi:sensor c-di-GMP phosphodiesterase-like protein
MLQDNHAKFAGCIALGGLSGALFGLVLCMLYRRNKSVEQQLRRAIRKDKLRVFYQPEVDLRSERIVGAEALVRWTDEDGVVVGPDVFVRIAEQRGFVGEITRLVLRHALRDFGETLRKNSDFRLSINVAAADLTDPEFLPLLDRSLGSMEVPPRALAIEITESSTARRETAIETIHSLRRRGHSVHIDDFGTGYSSLSYLHELSVDAIKIDKTFTQAIGTESVVVTILPQILSMAEALGLEVIVEGIETTVQAEYFTAFAQPILAQGWLFGRPVPADSFLRLLASDEKKSLQSAPATLELDLAVEKLP